MLQHYNCFLLHLVLSDTQGHLRLPKARGAGLPLRALLCAVYACCTTGVDFGCVPANTCFLYEKNPCKTARLKRPKSEENRKKMKRLVRNRCYVTLTFELLEIQ